MECPRKAGSAYFNYKNFYSIVLLAVCDAKYCFTFVDIGAYGSTNDASVLSETLSYQGTGVTKYIYKLKKSLDCFCWSRLTLKSR